METDYWETDYCDHPEFRDEGSLGCPHLICVKCGDNLSDTMCLSKPICTCPPKLPPPEYVRQIPANGVRYAFAERENGRCFWCVDSREEALQLAANLLQIAELYKHPITEVS